jgi:PAS domain S-box-containing protein
MTNSNAQADESDLPDKGKRVTGGNGMQGLLQASPGTVTSFWGKFRGRVTSFLHRYGKPSTHGTARGEMPCRDLLDTVPTGIAILEKIHSQFELTFLNRAAEQMIGHTASDIPDLDTWLSILAGGSVEHETTRLQIEDDIYQLLTRGTAPDREFSLVARDGTTRTISVSFTLVDSRIVATIQDHTEARQSEQTLQYQRDLLHETGRIAQIGGWDIDAITWVGRWTDDVGDIFGLTPGEELTVDQALEFFLPPSRMQLQQALRHTAATQTPVDLELEILSRHGVRKWVRMICHPVVVGGRVLKLRGTFQDITKKIQRDRELHEQERQINTLMASLPGMAYRRKNNPEWTLEFASEGVYQLTGYPREDLLMNRRRSYTSLIHVDDRLRVAHSTASAVGSHVSYELEYRIVTASGKVRWVWDRGAGIFDDNGNVEYVAGFVLDVTERMQAEQERSATIQLLDVVGKSTNVRSTLRSLTEHFRLWTGCEAVGLRFQDGDDFPYVQTHGFSEAFVKAERLLADADEWGKIHRDGEGSPMLQCLCGAVLRSQTVPDKPFFTPGGSFWTNSLSTIVCEAAETGIRGHIRGRCHVHGYESVALIPIRSGQKMLGLIQLNDRRKDLFSRERVEQFERLCAIVGSTIDRQMAEAAMKQSEAHYRTLFESSPIAIWEEDHSQLKKRLDQIVASGVGNLGEYLTAHPAIVDELAGLVRLIDVNHASVIMFGGSSKEDMLKSLPQYFGHDALKVFAAEMAALHAGKTVFKSEISVVNIRGEKITLDLTVSVQPGHEATLSRVLVSFVDISDSRKAHEEIREKESNFRTFFETLRDLVVVTTPDGRIVHANRASVERLGYDACALSRLRLHDLHPSHQKETTQRTLEELHRHVRKECHLPLITRNGEEIPVTSYVWRGKWNGANCVYHLSKDLSAVREAEQKFEHLFRNNPALIALTSLADNRFVDVNRIWLETLGYSASDVIGKTVGELRLFASDEQLQEAKNRIITTGSLVDCELQVRRKDGGIIDGLFSGERITIGRVPNLLTVMIDITARKSAEKELRILNVELERRVEERTAQFNASQESLRAVFDAAPTPLAICTPDLEETLLVNGGVVDLTGLPAHGLLGDNSLWSRVRHVDREEMLASLQAHGRLQGYEMQLTTNDDIARWYAVSVSRVTYANREAVVAGFHDVTQRKEAETVLQEGQELLRQANAELERGLRLKDEFMANMSHELRTPLSAILNMAELLKEKIPGPLNEKQGRYLDTIAESGHHLLNMINDILDLSKIEAGMIQLDMGRVEVRTVCESAARMIKQMAEKKRLHVRMELDPAVATMHADGRRLKQLLVNLLSNAVKFTPPGRSIGLTVQGHSDEHQVEIQVWDQGIGISDQDIPRLFKPFVQLDSSLAREHEGTGLGLSIVAQIARLHGGNVTVQASPDQGSRFTVILPWKSGADGLEPTPDVNDIDVAVSARLSKQQALLLVEDTPTVVNVLKDYLEAMGFTIVVSPDGPSAIGLARKIHPAAILMDIQMPGIDGFEATRLMRQDAGLKDTPIIAITALAMPGDRKRCLDAGMNDYVSKPVKLRHLADTIQKHLAH